ncbi:MAG TPA: hypothetical protein VFS97_05810 [Nitrososphaeraceae archaeon]|nr:hypothetical protein [Nitrososphaeraceae archaeon]
MRNAIASGIVRQSLKTSLIQYRNSIVGRNGPGVGLFEPTTSASTVSILVPSAVIGKKIIQIPPGPLCFFFDCPLPIPSSKVLRKYRIQSKIGLSGNFNTSKCFL